MSRFRAHVGLVVAMVGVGALLPGGHSPAAAGGTTANHCITPAGDDLNEYFGSADAFIAPFCTEMRTGDRWRAILRVQVAGDDAVFPVGYSPARFPLDEDFLTKFVSHRYVVDAGTRREREYLFSSSEAVVKTGELPDGTRFVRWMTPPMHPLPPGVHTVDEYVTLTDDAWDGLGLDPAINLIPAGESLAGSVQFEVVKPNTSGG